MAAQSEEEEEEEAAAAAAASVYGTFEWLANPEALMGVLADVRRDHPTDGLVVEVGCGTSSLVVDVRRLGFSRILSMDVDEATIRVMQRRHADVDGVRFLCADVVTQSLVRPGEAELVLDKGTLDCLLCGPRAADFVLAVFTMLRLGGHYVILSFHTASVLRHCLEGRAAWVIERFEDTRRPCASGTVRLVVLRKRLEATDDVFRADVKLDNPLLDAEREARLRAAWPAPLPLHEAYFLLFDGAERSEYALDDFKADLATYGQRRGEEEAPPSPCSLLSIDDALAFVREMQ